MSRKPLSELDLTSVEQENVRNALYFMRAKFEAWKPLARLLHFEEGTLAQAASGDRNVSANLTLRFAKLLGISVDALTSGQYPKPGACPRCGYHVPLDGRFKHASPSVMRRGTR